MNEKTELILNLDSELIERFKQVAIMKNDDIDNVAEKLISDYIAKSLESLLSLYKIDNKIEKKEATSNYRKAVNKISNWAMKPNQNNHKILRAFWKIEDEKGEVLYKELEERCSNKELYPDVYIEKFKGNFDQMKTDMGNSNGKVFEIYDGIKVKIWDEVYEEIVEYKRYFI
ncbi:hypothetical protein [Clostridium beijerinckii]|uniref:hypothetical protein n=1 Tax=Clostridium beijerinckii TaxID=1520 RepID=UPI0022DF9A81|nr:hypothetical protein [Clostridium beijerinckii]